MELTLKLSSGCIHGYRWGDPAAPLVICVHGLSANHTAFAWLAEGLVRAGYGVLAYDCRGRGRSEITPAGSYGLSAHARDVRELADHVGAERFHLAGWSMGAAVGMVAAGELGARLRSLVLLDHAGPVDPQAGELVRAGLARLDAVVDEPEQYLKAIRTRGLIDPWTPFWESHYRYELTQGSDGRWSPSTSRQACTEDLEGFEVDWAQVWQALPPALALVRTSVSLGGGLIVPPVARDGLARTCPWVTVAEVATNHWTVMTDPAMLTATVATLRAGAG